MKPLIDFTKGEGLVPAIIQDFKSGDVLMLGYMNEKSLEQTLKSGIVNFWSRTRQKLWMKGKESGNILKVKKIYEDCDKDALLIKAELIGTGVCHTGNRTCFKEKI